VGAQGGLALVNLHQGRTQAALRRFLECRQAAERLGDRRWAEYARRTAERTTTQQGRAAAVEIRPGMRLLDPPTLRPRKPVPAAATGR
jgi:hypothetical protein